MLGSGQFIHDDEPAVVVTSIDAVVEAVRRGEKLPHCADAFVEDRSRAYREGMNWGAFAASCPEIAGEAERRFRENELCMLGTLRADGSPRITPVEIDLAGGHLFLGMMWHSRKALDLLRDHRCVVHTCTSDRSGTQGDAKIYGRALDVSDPVQRQIFRDAIRARIDWAPDEPGYHLFSIDVTEAAYAVVEGEHMQITMWDPERGLRRATRDG